MVNVERYLQTSMLISRSLPLKIPRYFAETPNGCRVGTLVFRQWNLGLNSTMVNTLLNSTYYAHAAYFINLLHCVALRHCIGRTLVKKKDVKLGSKKVFGNFLTVMLLWNNYVQGFKLTILVQLQIIQDYALLSKNFNKDLFSIFVV